MEFHGLDVATQFKRMRELVPETYRAFLDFQAHTKKAANAGASDAEIAETTFVAMAMAAGAAWSHGGLALQCLQEHKGA